MTNTMTQIQQQFFALLRAGLWGKAPDAALFGAGTDWPALLAASKKQSVQAVVLDGVQMLPPDCRPPKALYLQWCALGLHTEEQNELLNRRDRPWHNATVIRSIAAAGTSIFI